MNGLDKARVELYNAAVAHAQYVMGDKTDFAKMIEVSNRLEQAARTFVRLEGIFNGTSGPG